MEISLAQWSLHRAIQGGRLRPVDFPSVARREFGIGAVELVSQLMDGWRREQTRELRRRADGEGVRILLIMIDDEGDLSHPDRLTRKKAARNHRKWIDAAQRLGCSAVRVNTGGERTLPGWIATRNARDASLRDPIRRCAESCGDLADYASEAGISVLLENHGGLSANAAALVEVVQGARRKNLGTLPDFGNFAPGVDKYEAVRALLPFAGAVSAKSFDFSANGDETTIDFPRMLRLVRDSGYQGHLGIEYEGHRLPEPEGIARTRALLERCITGLLTSALLA